MTFKIEEVVVPKERHRARNPREFHVRLFKSSEFRKLERKRGVYDHKGNEFPTIKAMCDFWGVSYHTYRYRRSRRVTLELALTLPIQ